MRFHAPLAALAATTAAAAAADDTSCASGLHIIVARGSLEPQGTGLTGSIADAVAKRVPGSRVVALEYPASEIDPFYTHSEIQGVGNMTKDVLDYNKKCPDSKMALLGWSQGGQVIMDVVCGGGGNDFGTDPPISDDIVKNNIVAMVILGDPTHTPGYPYDLGTSEHQGRFIRFKNSSEHCVQYKDRLRSYCDKGDYWCDAGNTDDVHSSYFKNDGTQITNFVVSQWNKLSGGSKGTPTPTPTPTPSSSSSSGATSKASSSTGAGATTTGTSTGGNGGGSGTGTGGASAPSNTGGAAVMGVSTVLVLGIPAVLAWML